MIVQLIILITFKETTLGAIEGQVPLMYKYMEVERPKIDLFDSHIFKLSWLTIKQSECKENQKLGHDLHLFAFGW